MQSRLPRLNVLILAMSIWNCGGCSHRPSRTSVGNQRITTFREAKRIMKRIYADHRRTLYCDCAFNQKMDIIAEQCQIRVKTPSKRATRVEWEHVVPARVLGKNSAAWQRGSKRCITRAGKSYKGRRCAKRVDEQFRRRAADLYNLFPAVGAINNARSSFAMAEIDGENRKFGLCDFEVFEKQVEPRPNVRGEIARTYLYFDESYPDLKILNAQSRAQFTRWSRNDSVDAWECERSARIRQIQGNSNRFVEEACKAKER